MAELRRLVDHLREPDRLAHADAGAWNALIRLARREAMIGQLGAVAMAAGAELPPRVRAIFEDAATGIAASQRAARWEARDAARLLAGHGWPVVLLKGAAYVMADLPAAEGRSVGDLDILVPRAALGDAEALLRSGGWEPIKTDSYDDAYYRQWMHELPPLAHSERGSIVDVHHTILPLTARLRPDAEALIADAMPVAPGLHVLSPPDMVLHSAAHLFYDGDFEGGLRNLWDIHRLLAQFDGTDFWQALGDRARRHQLEVPLARALRFANEFFGTKVDAGLMGRGGPLDRLIRRRLLARDAWGLPTAPATRRLLYVRSHWLRMPPALLTQHLFTKWRMRRAAAAPE